MSEFDFESIKNKAIEQLKAGKPLLGKVTKDKGMFPSDTALGKIGKLPKHFIY